MKRPDFHDHLALRRQLDYQRRHTWDLDNDLPWGKGIDCTRFFLPLDQTSIAFPGANPTQRLALSQLAGLIVNSTIAEMEDVAVKIRQVAWRDILTDYPVNPEMIALGKQFFLEEAKHSQLFRRYNDLFCEQEGIDPSDLGRIIPSAYGSVFQRAIKKNALAGGHAFWWVVASVEETSLLIYQNLYRHRKAIDPLFCKAHKLHFEEESKHTSYAFLMLDLIKERNRSFKQRLHLKTDLLYSELFSSVWILSELYKIKRVRELQAKHPFFHTLASCIPLLEAVPKRDLVAQMFTSAPYISLILNKKYHRDSMESAKAQGALTFPYPNPHSSQTDVDMPLVEFSKEQVWTTS